MPERLKKAVIQQIGSARALVCERLNYFDTSADEYGVFPRRVETLARMKQYKLKRK